MTAGRHSKNTAPADARPTGEHPQHLRPQVVRNGGPVAGGGQAGAPIAQPPRPGRILVVGLGNTLLQDEGVGVAALHRVAEALGGQDRSDDRSTRPSSGGPPDASPIAPQWPALPDHVTLLDGGVMGLELLPYIEDADTVLILDAVQTGAPPGTLVRLEDDEIPAVVALKMSVHEVGLQETLAMCQFRGTLPGKLVLWGVVPAKLDLGMALSPVVRAQLDRLVNAALDELAGWGVVREPALPAAP